jgi:coatomer protein complex subunit gamma
MSLLNLKKEGSVHLPNFAGGSYYLMYSVKPAMLTSEPSEEPVDISLVSREAESQQLQDKNAPLKEANCCCSCPLTCFSWYAYSKIPSSIPSSLGFECSPRFAE